MERKDYTILKTITTEAVVTYHQSNYKIKVTEANGECEIVFARVPFSNAYAYKSFKGVARYGFLTNDYYEEVQGVPQKHFQDTPEYVARNLAIYRLINACKVAGGDGVIEPIISTNVEQTGYRTVTFKTTVSAKIIKLNTDGK